MKRQRGRGRKPNGQSNRHFESNGPDIKIRGSAQNVYDKYLQLARDAGSSGDRIMAESYLQHAEHYFRILRAQQPPPPPRDRFDDQQGGDQQGGGEDGDQPNQSREGGDAEGEANPLEVVNAEGGDLVSSENEDQNEGANFNQGRRRRPRRARGRDDDGAREALDTAKEREREPDPAAGV